METTKEPFDLEAYEKRNPATWDKVLGDFMYAGARVRFHAQNNEARYFVLYNSGHHLEVEEYTEFGKARDAFTKKCHDMLYYTSNSDTHLYMQQEARPAKGTKAKYKRNTQ